MSTTLFLPTLLYQHGTFVEHRGLLADDATGRITAIVPAGSPQALAAARMVALPGRALLPGFVNAHSHAFQRLIRGKSESRRTSGRDFWSWRGTMYHAAAHLSPSQVYDVSRMAFLEMVRSGITAVGEFHYVHNQPLAGSTAPPYDDPNTLAREVLRAAASVGLRIALLRTAYLRAGFELPPDPGQARFYETTMHFLAAANALHAELNAAANLLQTVGIAPHSIRAVPLDDLQAIAAFARARDLPLHMHVSEQLLENDACVREFGHTPVELLARHGLLSPRFTAVHAIHLTRDEFTAFGASGATIASCPTTERNLGDGIFPADLALAAGIPLALGSDSQAQIDPLEDARQLDYHLRLRDQQRAILDGIPPRETTGNQDEDPEGKPVESPRGSSGIPLAQRLFSATTQGGADALGLPAGDLLPGRFADLLTVNVDDLSIAGHSSDSLLPLLVFSLGRSAICDVYVGGAAVLRDGHHPLEAEISAKYAELHRLVWGSATPA